MKYIREENYKEDMEHVVIPYLEKRKTSGDFARIPGQNIHYRKYLADEPHAEVVLVHGFSEGIDKWNESVYYFLQAGFHVWQIQQRGHGKSYRAVSDPYLIHIRDFKDLIEDLHYFVTDIVRKDHKGSQLPRYLFGHSMGGGVSAAYLETYPNDFSKAILSSPLLEMNTGNIPPWAAVLYGKIMSALGKGENYMPGSGPFRPIPDFENSCASSRARYEYWFHQAVQKEEYQMCASSICTALQLLKLTKFATAQKNCSGIRTSILLFQAGLDNMVGPEGQEIFLKQIGNRGTLRRFPDGKHELYMGSDTQLKEYWEEILSFYQL